MKTVLLSLFTICCFVSQSQTVKQIPAVRTSLPIKLDGIPDEDAWKQSPVITGLVEMRPTFGRAEKPESRSAYYLLYDDDFVYFGGYNYERTRDSVATQLAGRDEVGVNDFAGIIFDTYQDKINGLGFYVTPLNEQFDAKYAIENEDMSWNAVYHTQTNISDSGWSFEMRIPYSALRFSKEKTQNWNINILRRRAKLGEQFSWSPIDPTKFGFINQAGTWTGILDIKPPIRLSFSPYFSTYLTRNPATTNKWETSINGGMDVKYGISDGFTMDMTLIPDFGQVQSDNQVLNLSPFEVKFNENRAFFNEGTELFNKGNLFYSRRIGGLPVNYSAAYNDLKPDERVIENPVQTKLLNATKISGRTKKKLGIGFFNAITKAERAIIEDGTKNQRTVETSPLTNYNILVLDQGMKNNSRVTLINTNVWRSGNTYDANVSSVDWDLYDNNVNWNFWGQVAHSRLIGYDAGKTVAGNMYRLFFGKFKGRFNFDVHRYLSDDKYNQNDMGYFTNNNYVTHGFYAGYKWVKPKSFYNNIYINLNANYTQLFKPRQYQDFVFNGNVNGQLKNLWYFGITGDIRPERNDFYEARILGWKVKQPSSWMKGFWLETNSAKKYSAAFEMYHRSSGMYNTSNLEMYIRNTYRFSSKLSISLSHYLEMHNRNFGYAFSSNTDSVFMSLRRIRTAENILNTKYSFSNKMWLTLRVRHYWSKVHYWDFMNLKPDGNVGKVASVGRNPDINVNLFNVDMNYTWQFAPGSFINVTWKTASELFDQMVAERYYRNLRKSIDAPAFNSLSLKVIYFLDYINLQHRKKRNS